MFTTGPHYRLLLQTRTGFGRFPQMKLHRCTVQHQIFDSENRIFGYLESAEKQVYFLIFDNFSIFRSTLSMLHFEKLSNMAKMKKSLVHLAASNLREILSYRSCLNLAINYLDVDFCWWKMTSGRVPFFMRDSCMCSRQLDPHLDFSQLKFSQQCAYYLA